MPSYQLSEDVITKELTPLSNRDRNGNAPLPPCPAFSESTTSTRLQQKISKLWYYIISAWCILLIGSCWYFNRLSVVIDSINRTVIITSCTIYVYTWLKRPSLEVPLEVIAARLPEQVVGEVSGKLRKIQEQLQVNQNEVRQLRQTLLAKLSSASMKDTTPSEMFPKGPGMKENKPTVASTVPLSGPALFKEQIQQKQTQIHPPPPPPPKPDPLIMETLRELSSSFRTLVGKIDRMDKTMDHTFKDLNKTTNKLSNLSGVMNSLSTCYAPFFNAIETAIQTSHVEMRAFISNDSAQHAERFAHVEKLFGEQHVLILESANGMAKSMRPIEAKVDAAIALGKDTYRVVTNYGVFQKEVKNDAHVEAFEALTEDSKPKKDTKKANAKGNVKSAPRHESEYERVYDPHGYYRDVRLPTKPNWDTEYYRERERDRPMYLGLPVFPESVVEPRPPPAFNQRARYEQARRSPYPPEYPWPYPPPPSTSEPETESRASSEAPRPRPNVRFERTSTESRGNRTRLGGEDSEVKYSSSKVEPLLQRNKARPNKDRRRMKSSVEAVDGDSDTD